MKYQRKSPGRRDAHARVARDLAPPLPADDAGVLRRPRRPGAAGLRLGPGEREARELRGDVYVGVALRRGPGGRADGILSIPAKEVSLGSPRVGTTHVQAPTPHAPPLQAFLVDFSQQPAEE